MNQALINELALGLRRVDAFPASAVAAIKEIIQTYAHYQRKGNWNPDLFVGVVLEFIFRIHQNPLSVNRTQLKTVQRLEVAEILMSHLAAIEYDNDRQILFNTFFPTVFVSVADGNVPHTILSLLTSLSIATRNKKMLKTIGDWMLGVGVDSSAVLSIARDIATDLRTDENSEKYFHLPHTAFLFTSILLIAIAKLFNSKHNSPSKRLFTQVIAWIEGSPAVCFVPPHSAVFDLFRWVVNSEENQSRLHLALLTSISFSQAAIKGQLQIIPQILMLINDLRIKFEGIIINKLNNGDVIEKTTERLLQLIQVLIGTECLDWNEIHPIFEALEQADFPSTRLYEIMKSDYVKC